MSNNPNLFAANEIVGAIAVNGLTHAEIEAFASDPRGSIDDLFDIDSNIAIQVIENTNDEVVLTLPYYSELETMQSQMMSDESLDDVAGGEIIILICAIGGAFAGSAIAAGSTAAICAGGIAGAVIGGVAAGAVVAGGVAGGVGGTIAAKNKKRGK